MPKLSLRFKHLSESKSRLLLGSVLILFLVFLTYIPATFGDFIWDDDDIIVNNPIMSAPNGLYPIWFEPGAVRQYYPLVHTAYWVLHKICGFDPIAYHLFNILLHGINAIILWFILRSLSVRPAWLIAAIFAVHPVHVESVAWISETKNTLSGFFYLLSIFYAIRYWHLNSPTNQNKRNSKDYWLALIFYLCALHSKTVTVSLPVIILLLIWWKKKKVKWLQEIKLLIPFFAFGLMMGLLTATLEKHLVGANWTFSFFDRLIIAGKAFWFYLYKLIWPQNLIFIYPRWNIHSNNLYEYLFPLSALLVILILWLLRKKIGKGPVCAFAFFLVTLFPALGFFDIYPMAFSFVADHFQYLASIGPIALLCFLGSETLKFLRAARSGLPISIALLMTLGILTWLHNFDFIDKETLWENVLAKNPGAFIAWNNYGSIMANEGHIKEAYPYFVKTMELNPKYPIAYVNLANIEFKNKDYEKTLFYQLNVYRLSVQNGLRSQALNAIGLVYVSKNKTREAINYFFSAYYLNKENLNAFNNWRIATEELRNKKEVDNHYPEILTLSTNLNLIGEIN